MAPRIIMLLSVLALVLIGFVMIYSTSSVITLANADAPDAANPMADVLGQVRYAVAGLVLAAAIWKFLPCSVWRGPFVYVAWGLAAILLVATMFIGVGDEE